MPEQDNWIGLKMRTGRTVGRTVYIVNSDSEDRKKDHLVGLMDTPDLAEQVALRWNFVAAERVTEKTTAFSARALAAMDSVSLAHLVLSHLDEALNAANGGINLDTTVKLSVEVLH